MTLRYLRAKARQPSRWQVRGQRGAGYGYWFWRYWNEDERARSNPQPTETT